MGIGVWGDDDQDQLTMKSDFVRYLLNKPNLSEARLAAQVEEPDALPEVTNRCRGCFAFGCANFDCDPVGPQYCDR